MPCYNLFNSCPEDKMKLKFAWSPLSDMDGNTIWLKRYWQFGERWEFGFFVLRGKKQQFPDKQSFWDYIKYRVASVY